MNAIIFDLDGVLCHTDEYHYMAWKAIADELHIPFNREVNNQLRGVFADGESQTNPAQFTSPL